MTTFLNYLPLIDLPRNLVVTPSEFSGSTGLAYTDIKNLKKSEIVTGIDGGLWVCTHREKTGVPSRIPLLPQALRIIDKY